MKQQTEPEQIKVRQYQQSDAEVVSRLIADTYREFNLSFLPMEDQAPYLGPFQYARSQDKSHKEEMEKVISAPMVFIAEMHGKVVGVLSSILTGITGEKFGEDAELWKDWWEEQQ